ncbi:DUF6684 family protein [Halalkalicoccus jeotgali]|uniref:Uncharacterized protein n=1 Tax=Halalkalicoccus jeotgali (strain DSM 18796 / CECT 7217 / JCM 14584 / KCTC 4019 / B3) TaxID=795797 RepID=D8J5K4_HALJB|nr:DUF6684 family protein [Halalkalicoccus jeotgali]ADJ15700.1 hypothetical protein HacjB3_11585 [Halalkalicoccus jeotgali B3]ELY36530.1 hypothetical protein C497_11063 [Halalkalicoccus jeotgali B3]
MSRLLDDRVFNKETLLDSTVNLVPFAILMFFLVLYVVATPSGWQDGSLMSIYMLTIIISMIWGLLHLTYATAKRI